MSLEAIIGAGYRPFVASAAFLHPSFDLSPFGVETLVIDTSEASNDFYDAYLQANALAFGVLAMPEWVLTDCVLYQSAVVGFAAPRDMCPAPYLDALAAAGAHPERLDYVPVTGQIAGLTADAKTWFGFSLISHQRPKGDLQYQFPDGLDPQIRLATWTKALALEVYRARYFMGLTQYANRAVATHGLFGRMFLQEPVVWRHEKAMESFIYRMDVDFDISSFMQRDDEPFDFLLDSGDSQLKLQLVERMKSGERFEIVAPFRIKSGDGIQLPIAVR